MINVNLLPDTKLKGIKSRRSKQAAVSISIVVMLVSVGLPTAFFISDFLLQRGIASKQSKIDDLVNEFESKDDIQRMLSVQSQLDALPEVEGKKYYMSNLFELLEYSTPKNVSISGVNALSQEGVFELRATAQTILDANQFADTLESIEIVTSKPGDDKVSISPFDAPLTRTVSNDGGRVVLVIEGQLNSEFGEVPDIKEFMLKPFKLELEADKDKVIKTKKTEKK